MPLSVPRPAILAALGGLVSNFRLSPRPWKTSNALASLAEHDDYGERQPLSRGTTCNCNPAVVPRRCEPLQVDQEVGHCLTPLELGVTRAAAQQGARPRVPSAPIQPACGPPRAPDASRYGPPARR